MDENEITTLSRIREGMRARGITQDDLAESLGITQSSVSRMLGGAPFPSLAQLKIIANTLDMSLYYLIGIQESSYRELSPHDRKVIEAYERASDAVKEVIDRILLV